MKNKSVQANLVLLITAVIWGGGFVAQRLGMQQMGPYIFNGFRFFIGALTLAPIILIRKQTGASQKGNLNRTLLVGAVAGLFLFFGATFQQLGLVYTTAGKAGFITGLYVVIVPLLGMVWGDRGSLFTWLGAMLAVIGLYILSASRGVVFAPGDGFVLIGACFWAVHIQFIARYSPDMDVFQLSFVQSLFTSLISFGVGFFQEDLVFDQVLSAAIPILYGGVISIGLAYTLQVVGQRYAKPAPAAIILSLESVFAVFWGWLILSEVLTPKILAGSSLMLAGMMVSQIKRKKTTETSD
jgi:drug/metabolite transporter (DMT)-like permease